MEHLKESFSKIFIEEREILNSKGELVFLH